MSEYFLIVGLGNPGNKYEFNRHNVGFQFIDYFTKQANFITKFNGCFCKKEINNKIVFFAKPLTYMNLSGEFLSAFVNFYKLKIENILIIHDDLDIDFNKIKFRNNGSSAGHNGLKSIFKELYSQDIKRIKIGIGRPRDKNISIINYVLSDFNAQERQDLKMIFDRVNQFILNFLENDFKGNNCEI